MEDHDMKVEAGQAARPRLLESVRETIRARHYSRRTEETYIHWIKRFIYFTDKRQHTP